MNKIDPQQIPDRQTGVAQPSEPTSSIKGAENVEHVPGVSSEQIIQNSPIAEQASNNLSGSDGEG